MPQRIKNKKERPDIVGGDIKVKNRVAYFGVFTALALIFSYIETLVPISFGIPLREVYVLSIVRVLLSGVLFGNYFSIAYSLAGGLLSLTVMALLKKAGGFSVIGISIAGGVCHNIGQLVVAMIVVETFAMSYYMPMLLVAGLITGFLIGVVADQVLRRISDIMFLE